MRFLSLIIILSLIVSCTSPLQEPESIVYDYHPDSAFNEHWYDGLAEVNRYALTQNRYGKLRTGDAVLIFVTETHDTKTHVKVNDPSTGDLPVLKLNHYRRFPTGIYPYTFMTSTFSPVDSGYAAYPTRITHSMQEWCGQVFLQVDRWSKDTWQYQLHSYFEDESRDTELPAQLTEDGLLNLIRLDPTQFPDGETTIVPAAHYLRFAHQPWQAVEAIVMHIPTTTWAFTGDTVQQFQVVYPDLDREVNYFIATAFPYSVLGWETFSKGTLESRGVLTHQERLPYWQLNAPADSSWADSLGVVTH